MLEFTGVPFEQTSIEEWYKIIGVDLTGPFVCSREAVKHMEKQEHELLIELVVS